jgi:uncharacterized OB-fold protein
MMHTDRDDLERLVERAATARHRCTVCGHPVPTARIRCVTCPAPPLPETYRLARERLRSLVGSRP